MTNKTTVGKIATDLIQKTPDSRDPIELQREMQKDYLKNLFEAVNRGLSKYNHDFYIHVETKREQLLTNVIRNYFIDKIACPTPNYDQAVFKYSIKDQVLDILWCIPDRESCFVLKLNALQVAPEEREILECVLRFDDGTLLKLCKKLNGEELESSLLTRN